ncbi:molybdopterin-dependent oxidoreductase [Chloroflexota bacterium]
MNIEQIVKSTCELCSAGCGVLVHLRNGKPIRVEGDPNNPINKGALCVKGIASLEYLFHPDRLKHPIKRMGKKGQDKWQQISWDEALSTVAAALTESKKKSGVESVVFIRGGHLGIQDSYLSRFANVFGTPNVASMAPVCHVPRYHASVITYGFMANPDYEYPPAGIVLWGVNKCQTGIGECKYATEALQRGARFAVIDPGETEFTQKADMWIKPRPCSDLALALGMINVIINEGLFDKTFVEDWTIGFDKLTAHVQEYSPDKVEEITWVSAETIRNVARFYATSRPACIVWGNGIDNNVNNFQTSRAIAILRAITGNLGRPGGDIEWSPTGIVPVLSPEFLQQNALPTDMRQKRVSAKDGLLPIIFYALPQSIIKAMLEGDPYPIRTAFIQGGNLLQTYTNAKETYKALNNLDFLVVTDFFLTPTAKLADIVLPVGTYLEIDSIHESEYRPTVGVVQKVAQIGECWSDYKIWQELANRLDLGNYFREDEEQVLDFLLRPVGLTFDEFKKIGWISSQRQYRKYKTNGFKTPSGKVELYSSKLKEWGFDPLPVYHEPSESPYSDPDLAKEYPLIFTSHKSAPFHHSQGRQIASLRASHPEPIMSINPKTASNLGIREGDWVYIETKRGKIQQKATLIPDIDPRVVIIDYGWWFPKKEAAELFGWAESNINILTDNKPPYALEMGSATLRGILCKVYKVDRPLAE